MKGCPKDQFPGGGLIGRGLVEAQLADEKRYHDNMPLHRKVWHAIDQGTPIIGNSEDVMRQMEAAGIGCIEFEGVLWDTSGYGNLVWGYEMRRLGFSLAATKDISQIESFAYRFSRDPVDDQKQVAQGWCWNVSSPSCTLLWEQLFSNNR